MGETTARLLSSQGASVVVGARRSERIDKLADELIRNGAQALAVKTDVTNREQVQHLVDTAVRRFGRIDVMVNNAGVMPLAPLERLKVDEWDQMSRCQFERRALRHRRNASSHEASKKAATFSTSGRAVGQRR